MKNPISLLSLTLILLLVSTCGAWTIDAFAQEYSINKIQSGLVAYDPLDNETKNKQQVLANQDYWTYYGTAVDEKNTAYDVYKDSGGLHIGEPGPNPVVYGDGSYSGYYAMSPPTDAMLVHVMISATNQPVAQNDFQSQLEIMPESGAINYIDCAAITNSDGTYWAVVHGYGDDVEATGFDVLWSDSSQNQPLTRDCTVITNGQNYLKVYVDNNLVFSSDSLSLGMIGPYNYYFQTMNSYFNQMRHGTFRDYYVTTGESITLVDNTSNAATVGLVDGEGNVLASSNFESGEASMDVGSYHFPLDATLNFYDSAGSIIASTQQNIYGGDVYSLSVSGPSSVPDAPSNLASTATSWSDVSLTWDTPYNGGSPITGYEIDRSSGGSGWTTIVANTQNSATSYSDTGLQGDTSYSYRVFAINSVGISTESNISSTTTPTQPPPNQSPSATDDSAHTALGQSVSINVLANDYDPDGDALTVTQISSGPHNGSARINPNGTITYTPNYLFMGTDSFVYGVSDGRGGTASASVTITVTLL